MKALTETELRAYEKVMGNDRTPLIDGGYARALLAEVWRLKAQLRKANKRTAKWREKVAEFWELTEIRLAPDRRSSDERHKDAMEILSRYDKEGKT